MHDRRVGYNGAVSSPFSSRSLREGLRGCLEARWTVLVSRSHRHVSLHTKRKTLVWNKGVSSQFQRMAQLAHRASISARDLTLVSKRVSRFYHTLTTRLDARRAHLARTRAIEMPTHT